MTEQLLLRKLKPKRRVFTRPHSSLATLTSLSEWGLSSAPVAFLFCWERRNFNLLKHSLKLYSIMYIPVIDC